MKIKTIFLLLLLSNFCGLVPANQDSPCDRIKNVNEWLSDPQNRYTGPNKTQKNPNGVCFGIAAFEVAMANLASFSSDNGKMSDEEAKEAILKLSMGVPVCFRGFSNPSEVYSKYPMAVEKAFDNLYESQKVYEDYSEYLVNPESELGRLRPAGENAIDRIPPLIASGNVVPFSFSFTASNGSIVDHQVLVLDAEYSDHANVQINYAGDIVQEGYFLTVADPNVPDKNTRIFVEKNGKRGAGLPNESFPYATITPKIFNKGRGNFARDYKQLGLEFCNKSPEERSQLCSKDKECPGYFDPPLSKEDIINYHKANNLKYDENDPRNKLLIERFGDPVMDESKIEERYYVQSAFDEKTQKCAICDPKLHLINPPLCNQCEPGWKYNPNLVEGGICEPDYPPCPNGMLDFPACTACPQNKISDDQLNTIIKNLPTMSEEERQKVAEELSKQQKYVLNGYRFDVKGFVYPPADSCLNAYKVKDWVCYWNSIQPGELIEKDNFSTLLRVSMWGEPAICVKSEACAEAPLEYECPADMQK